MYEEGGGGGGNSGDGCGGGCGGCSDGSSESNGIGRGGVGRCGGGGDSGGGWMELDLKQVNYLRELVELRPENETMLDESKDNTTRKRERSRSQKIRRAVRRHEERVTAPAGGRRGRNAQNNKSSSGDHGSRAKAGTLVYSLPGAGEKHKSTPTRCCPSQSLYPLVWLLLLFCCALADSPT